jgi:hypothetical protein
MNFTIEKSSKCLSPDSFEWMHGFKYLKVFQVIKSSAIVVLPQRIQSRSILSGKGETQINCIQLVFKKKIENLTFQISTFRHQKTTLNRFNRNSSGTHHRNFWLFLKFWVEFWPILMFLGLNYIKINFFPVFQHLKLKISAGSWKTFLLKKKNKKKINMVIGGFELTNSRVKNQHACIVLKWTYDTLKKEIILRECYTSFLRGFIIKFWETISYYVHWKKNFYGSTVFFIRRDYKRNISINITILFVRGERERKKETII